MKRIATILSIAFAPILAMAQYEVGPTDLSGYDTTATVNTKTGAVYVAAVAAASNSATAIFLPLSGTSTVQTAAADTASNSAALIYVKKSGDTATPASVFDWAGGTHSGIYSATVTNNFTVSNAGSNRMVVTSDIAFTNFNNFSTYRNGAISSVLGFTHDSAGMGIGAWNAGSGFTINMNGSVTHGGGSTIGDYFNHPIFMAGSGTPSASRLGFGASPGAYWHILLFANYQPVRYEFWSTSIDGAGTDGIIYMVETNSLAGLPQFVFTNAPVSMATRFALATVSANVTNLQPLTVAASSYYLTGIGAASGGTDTITLSAPTVVGQQLDIACGPGTNKISIADSGTCDLLSTWTAWTNDTISLWAPTTSTWVERTRCVRP
jgi:hypothetical protein